MPDAAELKSPEHASLWLACAGGMARDKGYSLRSADLQFHCCESTAKVCQPWDMQIEQQRSPLLAREQVAIYLAMPYFRCG